jgi:hypothetical protein
MLRIISSTSASHRLAAARHFVVGLPRAGRLVIVAATRGAADDFARLLAGAVGATFGHVRCSLTELAARITTQAAGLRRLPATEAGAEAMAARAIFGAGRSGELGYFGPVTSTPGFPKALARTLHELRLAGIAPRRLPGAPASAADLGRLLAHFEDQLVRGGIQDRAALFQAAAAACRTGRSAWTGAPTVFLDVPLDSRAEREFVAALVREAPEVLATIPDGDVFARNAFAGMGGSIDHITEQADSDLATLRRYVFAPEAPPRRTPGGDVSLFSAPGEAREAVEIVRRVLDEAARGVPFDEMAVLLRAPGQYLGLLEHACARASVPVCFDRGVRRPDPAGRAFLALLSCAVDGLSAKRFDEYLSLGQVPQLSEVARSAPPLVVPPEDEVFADLRPSATADDSAGENDTGTSADDAVVAGTLRSPWKWEELIVESAVVGGRTPSDGKARWRRRLDGLATEFRLRIAELRNDEPESPRIAGLERDLRNLAHLRQFALPIIDELSAWPDHATWGAWLDRFVTLATRALKRPTRVLRTLADLRPMADVGPVTLEEARDVLHDRLVNLDWDPPARRYGRLFVGTPHQARGRTFRVVFVPGLAERGVPQRPHEDPLLLDESRRDLDPDLVDQQRRGSVERLLLKIAIGAAGERLYLSYPRLDVAETRVRVPSFYALDVVRAMTGLVPDHRVLASDAAETGGAALGWPAPADPDQAIDDLEHDLAVLRPLLDARDASSVKGRAQYILGLNDTLRRAVRSRWTRNQPSWFSSDGLVNVGPAARSVLAQQRLNVRPYSLSALQRYATCPYQFLLSTIHRLEPRDEPEPLIRLDPLTRGSLYHKVQAEFFRAMKAKGLLPFGEADLSGAAHTLDDVLGRVAAEYGEALAPAIDRVWRDEIADLGRDLGIWVQRMAGGGPWAPTYFEFSFGLNDEGRDPASQREPVVLDQGFILRGSVDLIESNAALGVLRVTDHKTGKNRSGKDLVVGGGTVLQPVLYGVAVERALGQRVVAGRLFYSTTAGGFAECEIPLNDYTRTQGLNVLAIVDRAIEAGFLPAAPAERACGWCDFHSVCGPREEERVKRKKPDRLADLTALRGMR